MANITSQYFANVVNTGNRTPNNPAGSVPYSQPVPGGLNRAHLFIQNRGANGVELSLSVTGATVSLFGGASISIDNYNGGFTISSFNDVSIQEAFAQ